MLGLGHAECILAPGLWFSWRLLPFLGLVLMPGMDIVSHLEAILLFIMTEVHLAW